MEDILLNSISLQLHKHPELEDLPIYTDRVNQDFKVPALYVYLAYAQDRKKLRNREFVNRNVNYSFYIMYKNGKDEMYQQDALNKYGIIREIFTYLNVETPDGKKYVFQVDDVDLSFNDVSMMVMLRFKIPYRIVFDADLVKSLEHKIIMKEED